VDVDCETLLVADEGQVLILLTARAGTPAQERLELLRVIGQQDLAPSAAGGGGGVDPGHGDTVGPRGSS
jgi:hypothetical protein